MLSEKAFLQAIEENQNIIHKVCAMYAQPGTDKEDLFQEVLLNAWKGIQNFKGDSKFSTWLYRVALNTAITFFKKEKKHAQTIAFQDQPEVEVSGAGDAEEMKAMEQAIHELSDIEKAIVMLYFEEYSHQEIGDILGISANNVGVKMNRIKTKLKESTKKFL